MAERPLPLLTYDPELLKHLCTLFQEIWAVQHVNIGSRQSADEVRELKNRVASQLLRDTELADFDPARIKERALARLQV